MTTPGDKEPTEIKYVVGDATRPEFTGRAIIAHVCNNIGGWGAGFVLSLSKRWDEPEDSYRQWHHRSKDSEAGTFMLGQVQFVPVGDGITVANMIAQLGYGSRGTSQHRDPDDKVSIPLRYDSLRACLEKVAKAAELAGASVHMPRIGCSLAGGSWAKVEPIIVETLCAKGIAVTVYDFPNSHYNP